MKALVGRLQVRGFRPAACVLLGALLAFVVSITGCLTEGSGSEAGTDVVSDPSTGLPPLTTPERTICDPFNAGGSARDRGLVGHLLYLTDDQPRYSSVADYIANAEPVQSTLYFDKLFIPTRAWDLGFFTQEGQLVTNHNNQPLYEYFAVRLESQLMLAAGEAPGWYQLAVLSDDGSRLSRINGDGSQTVLVNNDGTHPTRMGCGGPAVYMERNTKLPVVFQYFQGPRYHISMVVLWRPVPDGVDPTAAVSDPECGRSGNSRYFNSNVVPSEPTATYYDLLTRGWKPLENENYYFPEQASNPCATEDPLLISNFTIVSSTRTSVTVSWQTSLPATSKVQVKNVTTGALTHSPDDPTLRTVHTVTVTVTGLSANTLYAVRATSVSAGLQSVSSDERAFRTSRQPLVFPKSWH